MVVYKITNKVNGKIYIGKTERKGITRFKEHIKDSKYALLKNKSQPLYRAMLKYGTDKFYYEDLEVCNSSEELSLRETYWICTLNSINSKIGYNATIGGDGSNPKYYNKETRLKMSKSAKRYFKKKGKFKRSKEVCIKISKALRGKKFSPERLKRYLKGGVGFQKGSIPWNKNKNGYFIHTDESKRRIRKAALGRKHSLESIEKLRLQATGRRHSTETKRKISEAQQHKKVPCVVYAERYKNANTPRERGIYKYEAKKRCSDYDESLFPMSGTWGSKPGWHHSKDSINKMKKVARNKWLFDKYEDYVEEYLKTKRKDLIEQVKRNFPTEFNHADFNIKKVRTTYLEYVQDFKIEKRHKLKYKAKQRFPEEFRISDFVKKVIDK